MREYLETFFRRKWLFFVPFLAVLAVAIAGGLYTSWTYEVQSRLQVQSNPILDQAGQQLSLPQTDAKDEYNRLSELLLTDDFLKKVISSVPALKASTDTDAKMRTEIDRLRTNLNAWAPAQNLINFRYQDRDPQVAQQVVSKTIDLYLAQRYADRVGQADSAIGFLDKEYTDYQQQLQQASAALSTWEKGHPPAQRATLPESDQLEYQRLKTQYQSVVDHWQYVGSELEKAKFTKEKMIETQASTYVVKDPPVVPAGPNLSLNKLLSLLLLGLAVAAGLGFSVVALATWFGGPRLQGAATSALPAWLSRMMAAEEQTA
ncbi:MAG TPA: hypothetical protein VKY74_08600 [Chloroflexia bacterium]|nr:hypothetical protein [Chloroflexia bacterium]